MSWHLSYHYLIYSLGFYLFVGIFCNFFNLFGSILDSIFGKSLKKSKLSYLKYSKIMIKAICCDFLFGDSFLITFNGHTCDPSIQVLYFYLFVFSSYLFIYLSKMCLLCVSFHIHQPIVIYSSLKIFCISIISEISSFPFLILI